MSFFKVTLFFFFYFYRPVVVLVLIHDLQAAVVLKPSHKLNRNEETFKWKVMLKHLL